MDAENLMRSPTRSRIPGPSGLREMSPAGANGRSGIPVPASIANKSSGTAQLNRSRTISHSPEHKRGNSLSLISTGSRTATGSAKTHGRANSSVSRAPSISYGTKTHESFSATVGPGSRPPSAIGVPRPKSSLGGARKQPGVSISRPATALDTHAEEPAGSVLGKRKGMPPFVFYRSRDPSTCDGDLTDMSDTTSLSWSNSDVTGRSGDCDLSICRDFGGLTLNSTTLEAFDDKPMFITQREGAKCTRNSKLPKYRTPVKPKTEEPLSLTPRPSTTCRRPPGLPFLTKESSIRMFNERVGQEWDQESREKTLEKMFELVVSKVSLAGQETFGLKEALEIQKSRITELEHERKALQNELDNVRKELTESNLNLRVELETTKRAVAVAEEALKEARREHEIAIEEYDSRQRIEMEKVKQQAKRAVEALVARHQVELTEVKQQARAEVETVSARHQLELAELARRLEGELETERAARQREVAQLSSQRAMDTQRSQIDIEQKDREIARLQGEVHTLRDTIEREKRTSQELRQNLDSVSTNSVTMESSIRALQARIVFLESGREEQSQEFERLNQQMMDAIQETNATKEKLRKEETLRRKLHNQVQELKGNIRVFCRVRPPLDSEAPTDIAQIQYPDESLDAKEIAILGPEERSSLGTVSRKNSNFSFDRVFGPATQNAEVFEEISQLVQSALDGYNVCIFCYGQTGSGKTHTMSSGDGMIPRAVHQIYETARSLEEKGWTYTMEGNFVEVYNENLNDLLGRAEEFDRKKHEIRHDMQRCKTAITDITTVQLDSPEMVEMILRRAASNRSVAATKANERSSRSHSVFILKLTGQNSITGERSEGTLNLVDLAGSERLSHSGATGERLKETQNINRSLSCLGDVIAALGQGKEGGHIPYRNSKLTYLLQFSLGGNSKTLMFVMVSPLQAHLSETLTSLKFATKVHNTHIGTAKRQSRIRD